MHGDHARGAFGFLLEGVAETLVERDVPGHQLVGVEAHALQLVRAREVLGVPQQPQPVPLPLPVGMDRHIDDQQFIALGHGFNERSEEKTSELQSLMRTSYAVLCLKTKQAKTMSKNTK